MVVRCFCPFVNKPNTKQPGDEPFGRYLLDTHLTNWYFSVFGKLLPEDTSRNIQVDRIRRGYFFALELPSEFGKILVKAVVIKERKGYDEALFGANYYEKEIYNKISDICISMKSRDYLDLPETIFRKIKIHLSPKEKERYDTFEREKVLELLENEDEITAVNAAALSGKLLQFANGAIYDEQKVYHEIHQAKLNAIEEIVDTATSPVLIFYWFKHDLERLEAKLARFKPEHINTPGNIKRWNEGKINVLFAHPASAGHGLNLQFGGNTIIWFSQTWSLEITQQANARLNRPGQVNTVVINNLIVVGTMDEYVMKARDRKEQGQEALMAAVKARIDQYR